MIKVTLGEKPKEYDSYPILKEYKYLQGTRVIALFTSESKGVILNVIKHGSHECADKAGDLIEDWKDAYVFFTDYNEPITLQNV